MNWPVRPLKRILPMTAIVPMVGEGGADRLGRCSVNNSLSQQPALTMLFLRSSVVLAAEWFRQQTGCRL